MDYIGDEKHCKCMDCSYNRAEERYLERCLEQDEGELYGNDWGWN